MTIEQLMNADRKSCAAYGCFGKANAQRNRRGREWWQYQTALYEKLNKRQPVTVYKITGSGILV